MVVGGRYKLVSSPTTISTLLQGPFIRGEYVMDDQSGWYDADPPSDPPKQLDYPAHQSQQYCPAE